MSLLCKFAVACASLVKITRLSRNVCFLRITTLFDYKQLNRQQRFLAICNFNEVTVLIRKANRTDNLYTFEKNQLKELAHIKDDVLGKIKNPTIENTNYKSKYDTDIHGFIIKRIAFDSAKKYSAILWINGGLTSQQDFYFNSTTPLYAANRYVVLLINPKYSKGYR